MSETANQIEVEAERQSKGTAIPMWIWGVTAFVACYAVMQLQRVA